MNKFLKNLCITVVLFSCCNWATAYPSRQVLDRIVATVNDDVVTQSELDKQTNLMLSRISGTQEQTPPKSIIQRQVLNKLIQDLVLLQLAERTGITVDSMTINATIENIAKQNGMSLHEFNQHLNNEGISLADYREELKKDIIIQRLQHREVVQDVAISQSDIEGYLNSPLGQDQSGAEYHIRHIMLLAPDTPTPTEIKKVEQKAEGIMQSLRNGEDFAKVAMTQSAASHALQGGDLGWRSLGELPTLFVSSVPTMDIGEVVGPIRSSGGFHIIKLEEKRVGNKELHVEYHTRHILVKPGNMLSDAEAETILSDAREEILSGKSPFEVVAEQKSQELSTSSKGGDMGWITEKSVLPEFYSQISSLKLNEVSKPFKTAAGWHVVQVLEKRTEKDSSEAAWNQAREILRQRKVAEAIDTWVRRMKDEAQIEVFIDEETA